MLYSVQSRSGYLCEMTTLWKRKYLSNNEISRDKYAQNLRKTESCGVSCDNFPEVSN